MPLTNLGDLLRLPTLGERTAYLDLRHPHRPRAVTAFEFDALVAAVGRGLRRLGVERGARVGILAENRLEFLTVYFGAMRMGAVAVPINHRLPPDTIEFIFRDSAICLAFADASRLPLLPPDVRSLCFDDAGPGGYDAFLDHGPLQTVEPEDGEIAEILYTSGSTGTPKGVPLDHRGQLWAVGRYLQPLDPAAPPGSTVVVAPLYHMNGLFFSTVALASRLCIVSMPRFDARKYLETVARFRCEVLSGIPTMFALMVRERDLVASLDLRCVREITIGSAPLSAALLAEVQALYPNARVRNGFGTTETGPAAFGPHPGGVPTPPLSLGYPMAGVECQLVDGPNPDEGILALRTPALMRGYLNRPDLTAERIRDGWYVTGDVLRRDTAGFYYFVGRADDMIVAGGENVYPGQVESVLERHPAVAQAVVVGAPDDVKGEIPVAFVVLRDGVTASPDELRAHALRHGPAYAHPRLIEFVDELPVAGTHKVDRAALARRARELAHAAGRTSERPP
jgi:acyl-CoA synthetase (AMP-forming)/AMP-acid ligase II